MVDAWPRVLGHDRGDAKLQFTLPVASGNAGAVPVGWRAQELARVGAVGRTAVRKLPHRIPAQTLYSPPPPPPGRRQWVLPLPLASLRRGVRQKNLPPPALMFLRVTQFCAKLFIIISYSFESSLFAACERRAARRVVTRGAALAATAAAADVPASSGRRGVLAQRF